MDKWAELRTAYQVAKLGTVSAAAKTLGFHRATVNRHIDALEEELGASIFIRHARGYTLTELGEEVLRTAQKTEELMNDLAGRAKVENAHIEGEIKLTTLGLFAPLIIEPVREFRVKNPHCTVHISITGDLAKLEHGEAHIALRAGAKPSHPDYIVSIFRTLRFNLYAQDSYIKQYGIPKNIGDFTNHQFIRPALRKGPPFMKSWFAKHIKTNQVAMSSDEVSVNNKLVLAGLGIGFLNDQDVLGRTDIHPVFPADGSWFVTIWLVTHVDLHRTSKVQTMLSCLKDQPLKSN